MASNLTNPGATDAATDLAVRCAYVGFLTAITDANVPTVTETADATGKVRKAVTWDTAANRAVANSAAGVSDDFTEAATIVGVGFYAAASGGSPAVVKIAAGEPLIIAPGDNYKWEIGDFTLTF